MKVNSSNIHTIVICAIFWTDFYYIFLILFARYKNASANINEQLEKNDQTKSALQNLCKALKTQIELKQEEGELRLREEAQKRLDVTQVYTFSCWFCSIPRASLPQFYVLRTTRCCWAERAAQLQGSRGRWVLRRTLSCRIEAMGGIAAIAVLFGKPCS